MNAAEKNETLTPEQVQHETNLKAGMFDVTLCEKYVESLIQHDEVERALMVLDNLPALLRDRPPMSLVKLRTDIVAALITTHAYMNSGLDSNVREDSAVANLQYNVRGQMAEAEVRKYNAAGVTPHLVDVGPGEYWIPLGLKKLGLQFTYWDVAVDTNTQAVAHPLLKDYRFPKEKRTHLKQPQIFLALEIIEHLPQPLDLATECLRHCGEWPERIHLSTPMYCYDPSPKDWRKPCGLPHLRAYTPHEFHETAKRVFPGYEWQMYADRILSLRGLRWDVAESKGEALIVPRGK